MKPWLKNTIVVAGIILLIFMAWYFRAILAYIAISAVLSLMGRPVTDFLAKLGLRNYKIPRALATATTLFLIYGIIYLFFRIFVPVIVSQAKELSAINYDQWLAQFEKPLQTLQQWLQEFKIDNGNNSVKSIILEKLNPLAGMSFLSDFFTILTGFLGNLFVAVFSITFITFFFLKDENLFSNALLALVPSKSEKAFSRAMKSIKELLVRYFVGLAGEVTCIIILVTSGMLIIGLKFQHAMIIGLFAGIVNVIPYVGPLIGIVFGLMLGMATHINGSSSLLSLAFLMLGVFAVVHLIDNLVFQPWIYSSSVHAHPLEIFLVILMAGSLYGVPGMVVAIPSYTVLRVFAREFLYNFKLVKKLTGKMKK
jgi:predicted PurR-regulated permease PerM